MFSTAQGAMRNPYPVQQPAPHPQGVMPTHNMSPASDQAPNQQGQAAAFARARLIAAQRAGYLPQQFNIAKTKQNLIGQWQQLSGAVGNAHRQQGTSGMDAARQRLLQSLAGLGGQFSQPQQQDVMPSRDGLLPERGMGDVGQGAGMGMPGMDPAQMAAVMQQYQGLMGGLSAYQFANQ